MSEPIVEPPLEGGEPAAPPAPRVDPPAPSTDAPGDLGWLGYPGDESLADGDKDHDD